MELKPGYKKTEVGVIPEDWEVRSLSRLGTFRGGNGFSIIFQGSLSGDYPFFKVSDMNNDGNELYMRNANHWISEEVRKKLSANKFPAGSIVFAKVGAAIFLERKRLLIQESCLDNNMMAFTLYDSRSNERYFHYMFLRINLGKLVSTTALPSLSAREIGDLRIPLPPITEQTAIATVLSDTDALIESLEQLIEKKRLIKQGAMQELLTGKRRLPGFAQKTGDKHTEVGVIPEDWEMRSLGEIATIRDGTHQTPKYVAYGVPFYSVENVTNDDFTNTKFISFEEHKNLSKSFKIEKGDILMTRIGSIGECKLIDWDVEASFYVSLALLKINKGIFSSFIFHVTRSLFFKNEIEKNSLQLATPKKINLGPISKIKIVFPKDFYEQEIIASVLSDMDKEIRFLEEKLSKYRQIKQGMMQELLKGRIRLV